MSKLTPKILIVDDQPNNLHSLEKVLMNFDVEIIKALSAIKALNVVLNHTFCLAIVDIQMPEMDGYEFVELLRSNKSTATLPVIFISAIHSDEYYHHKGYGVGAVDFLSKPFNSEILLSKVKVFIDLYKQKIELEEMVVLLNEANSTLSKHTAQLKINSLVAQQITSILDLDELLITVANSIQSRFDYYFVGIWLTNKQNNALNLHTSTTKHNILIEDEFDILNDVAPSIINLVYKTKQYYLADDVLTDPNYLAIEALPDTRSELVLPLLNKGYMLGVLDIQSEYEAAFTQNDQMMLQALANQIAVAIRNAQLYQLEQHQKELLAKLNQDKDTFFSIVAHDLRSPFTPVLKTTKKLIKKAKSLQLDEFQHLGETIYKSADNVYNLLENLLQWVRMQMGRMVYQPGELNLLQIITQNINLLHENALDKNISLQTNFKRNPQNVVIVHADEYMLNTILRNLLTNAIKFTPNGGLITASISLIDNFVEVAIIDTGRGIKPKQLKKLFKIDTHYSTQGTDQEQGTGLGLIMCKEMIEMNKGQIKIESTYGQGTTIKFTLPLITATFTDDVLTTIQNDNTIKNGIVVNNKSEITLEHVNVPPLKELQTLLSFAQGGNMKAIIKYTKQLKNKNKKVEPFANQIIWLARQFEDEEILQLLKQYISNA